MSQNANDLMQSRADAQVMQSTLLELAAALIAAGISDERIGC